MNNEMDKEMDNKDTLDEAQETLATQEMPKSQETPKSQEMPKAQEDQEALKIHEEPEAKAPQTDAGAQPQEAKPRPSKKKLMEYSGYGNPEKRPTWIRVVCIIAVVLLVGLIIATLIAAIAGASKETIMALILCDGIIPIFIWVFLKITQKSLDRRKEAEKYYGKNQN